MREEKKASDRDILFQKERINELIDKVKVFEGDEFIEDEDDILESDLIQQAKVIAKAKEPDPDDEFAEIDRAVDTMDFEIYLKD